MTERGQSGTRRVTERADGGPLDELVREARERFVPPREPDWDRLEAAILARAREAALRDPKPIRSRTPLFTLAAAALAVAAVGLLVVKGDSDVDVVTAARVEAPSSSEPSHWLAKPGKRVRIAGTTLNGENHTLAQGDVVETQGDSAEFVKPGRVSWALEQASRVSVVADGATLVLALARGAVEAEVTPVTRGEAFAVDVGLARVAVHGTHLRVSIDENRVTVDLSEGVVAIGLRPRRGMTLGRSIHAPAHVTFDPRDIEGSLQVVFGQENVRPPRDLPSAASETSTVALPLAIVPPTPAPLPSTSEAPSAGASSASRTVSKVPPVSVALVGPEPQSSEEAANRTPESSESPETRLLKAIRACEASRPRSGEGVKVVVTSRLELRVAARGTVEYARFDPPLAPQVQTCAADAIYRTQFTTPGIVSMTVEIEK